MKLPGGFHLSRHPAVPAGASQIIRDDLLYGPFAYLRDDHPDDTDLAMQIQQRVAEGRRTARGRQALAHYAEIARQRLMIRLTVAELERSSKITDLEVAKAAFTYAADAVVRYITAACRMLEQPDNDIRVYSERVQEIFFENGETLLTSWHYNTLMMQLKRVHDARFR
jgi:hypothetical protein